MSMEIRDGGALLSLLANAAGRAKASTESPKPLPMQARVLRDMYPLVTADCPFSPGDLVQMVPSFNIYRRAISDEKIVALVIDVGPHCRGPEPANRHDDMYVLMLIPGDDGKMWAKISAESWRFQKYDGPIEGIDP